MEREKPEIYFEKQKLVVGKGKNKKRNCICILFDSAGTRVMKSKQCKY